MTRPARTLATVLALSLAAPAAATERLVQVVVDHSGVLHDEQDPQGKSGFNRFLAEFLSGLARAYRRDRNRTRIVLISAVEPAYILWSGSAADFYREGLHSPAVEAVVAGQPNGCNNLITALDEVAANARIEAAGESLVHVITSGVHSGPDCAGLTQEDYVRLVETADPEVISQIGTLAPEVDALAIHFLTATQRRAYLGALDWREAGISLAAQGEKPAF